MAKAKKKTTRAKKARRVATKARRPKRSAGRTAAAGAATRRVAELEAENRRLRDEIEQLRAQVAGGIGADASTAGERPPALEL
jgi:hypothetical protein